MVRQLSCSVLVLLAWLCSASEARDSGAGPSPALKIVSLNLAMREDVGAIASEMALRGLSAHADVVLLQEVIQRDGEADVASRLGDMVGLHTLFRPAFALDAHRRMGLAILSRYAPSDPRVLGLKRFDLSFRSRHRIALGALLETPAGAIRVYNVHLDTRINIADRVNQLSAVTDDVDGVDAPTIVGGDFNTNDNRWLFHTMPLPFLGHQRDGVLRFMQGFGFQSAFTGRAPTHDALGMQLDWIFVRGLRAVTTAIQPMAISDHHALVASLTRAD